MLRMTGTSIIAAMAIILSACALEPATTPPVEVQSTELTGLQAEDRAVAGEAADPASTNPTDGATNIAANCSIVQWCNAPGSDGTRCIQQGCSFDAARTECINEGWAICGTPLCPWALIDTNGVRHELCF